MHTPEESSAEPCAMKPGRYCTNTYTYARLEKLAKLTAFESQLSSMENNSSQKEV